MALSDLAARVRLKTDLKLAVRIRTRYRDQGEAAGLAYGVTLVRQMPHLAERLLALLTPPQADAIRAEVSRQQADRAARQAAQASQLQALDDQAAQERQARQAGTAVRYLAGLAPTDRDRLATPAERREAVALRQSALMTGKVRALLGCTQAELERWHGDGRLPHLYTRVVALPAKAQACRFWAEGEVLAAQAQVDGWRAADTARRRRPHALDAGVLSISTRGRECRAIIP